MLDFLKNYRKVVVAILILIISMVLLAKNPKENDTVLWYERVVIFFVAPFQSVANYITVGTANGVNKYFWLADRFEENRKLRDENLRLRGANFRLSEIREENKRFRELLKFKEIAVKQELLAAEVISVDAKSEFRSIRINRGSSDGVKEQYPVVTAEGIVGQVLRVYHNYSDILLITDKYSFVDAVIQRIRTRGVLEGNINNCNLKYVLRNIEVEVGDIILSSGLDMIFPKGLQLGSVSFVKKEKYGIDQEIQVKPVVDFDKLEEVLVILRRDENEFANED